MYYIGCLHKLGKWFCEYLYMLECILPVCTCICNISTSVGVAIDIVYLYVAC